MGDKIAEMRDEAINWPKGKRVSDLDEKIRGILLAVWDCGYTIDEPVTTGMPVTEAKAAIKQVFADAGYALVCKDHYRDKEGRDFTQYIIDYADGSGEFVRVPYPRVEDGTLYPLLWAKKNGYRTGQEWYDHFIAIYDEPRDPQVCDATIIRQQVDKIAKRTAGLPE